MLAEAVAGSGSFAEQLVLAVAGPLVTVFVGGLVVWGITWSINRRADERRAERDWLRADADRQAERVRAEADRERERERAKSELENKLRSELLETLLEPVARLYMATQHFDRVLTRDDLTDDERRAERSRFDSIYLEVTALQEVLQVRMEALFESPEPVLTWHQIGDLLTVRYMTLVGRATPRLLEINSNGFEGKRHTGLSVEQMQDKQTLLMEYHEAFWRLAPLVLEVPLRRRSGLLTPATPPPAGVPPLSPWRHVKLPSDAPIALPQDHSGASLCATE